MKFVELVNGIKAELNAIAISSGMTINTNADVIGMTYAVVADTLGVEVEADNLKDAAIVLEYMDKEAAEDFECGIYTTIKHSAAYGEICETVSFWYDMIKDNPLSELVPNIIHEVYETACMLIDIDESWYRLTKLCYKDTDKITLEDLSDITKELYKLF